VNAVASFAIKQAINGERHSEQGEHLPEIKSDILFIVKKILIIEDDASIANLQKDYLELSGYAVEIADNGTDGLAALDRERFDLILLDVMLPGIGGFEVLRAIREQEETPVLLVSARAEEIYKVNGLGLGADDYITKPFGSGELVARVNAHLSKFERMKERFGKEREGSKLVVRGLEVQKESRRVFVNGTEVALAQKELRSVVVPAPAREPRV
jgi:DNA-binding response OmpR family regulator